MITAAMVKELRQATGAGVLDCRQALEKAGGVFDKAVEILRREGLTAAAKRAGREAREGLIEAYVHTGSRVAALVELNCETDFVARTPEFRHLAHDLAMQVVACGARYLSPEEVPAEVVEMEKAVYRAQAEQENKPPQVIERIVEGRLQQFYQEVCLLEQPYIRDGQVKVRNLISDLAAKTGENIVVRRFVRFQLGE